MSKTFYSQIRLILFFFVASLEGSTGLAIEGEETFDMIHEARTIARTGNSSEALDKLQEAIVLADENEEKLALAIAHNNVAEIHRLWFLNCLWYSHYLRLYASSQDFVDFLSRARDTVAVAHLMIDL